MTEAHILLDLRTWKPEAVAILAAKLLIAHQPKFHGSKTIHYADGSPKKLVDNVTRDLS